MLIIKPYRLMIHEFQKTIDGLLGAICTIIFTSITLSAIDMYVRIVAGILGGIASIYVISYYRRQLKKKK